MSNSDLTQDKRERFVRLAEARTEKAIKAIRVIGNLSNRSNYSYSDEDVREISTALQSEITSLRSRFKLQDSQGAPQFKLTR
jgi:hypothetical protein